MPEWHAWHWALASAEIPRGAWNAQPSSGRRQRNAKPSVVGSSFWLVGCLERVEVCCMMLHVCLDTTGKFEKIVYI